jgi:hypothetical protein
MDTTYTPEQQHVHRCELVAALLSGKYQEGQGHLHPEDAFCCLGVACEISGLGTWGDSTTPEYVVTRLAQNRFYLPSPVSAYYGFTDENGHLTEEGCILATKRANEAFDYPTHNILIASLAAGNDANIPHVELAAWIAKGWVETETV